MSNQYPLSKYSDDEIEELLSDPNNPVVFTYMTNSGPVTIPIWIHYEENRFYIFAGKSSGKVKSIKSGFNKVAINIIQRNLYPYPTAEKLSYLGIRGVGKIINYNDNDDVASIQLRLLDKYDPEHKFQWIDDLRMKLRKKPENAWLIEITPKVWFSY